MIFPFAFHVAAGIIIAFLFISGVRYFHKLADEKAVFSALVMALVLFVTGASIVGGSLLTADQPFARLPYRPQGD